LSKYEWPVWLVFGCIVGALMAAAGLSTLAKVGLLALLSALFLAAGVIRELTK